MTDFNPDRWLTSAFNVLTEAVKGGVDGYVLDDTAAEAGLEIYDVVMDYFAADRPSEFTELDKTTIHFIIDNIENSRVGIGPQAVAATEIAPTIPDAGTITEQLARSHRLNIDVGIWASDNTGGSSSRLDAYEMLDKLFNPDAAIRFADGVEIVSFNNGRFVTETLNDLRVFRVVGAELVVRVYSRDVAAPVVIADQGVTQAPELEIDSVPLTD
jgi:hypothetical protein